MRVTPIRVACCITELDPGGAERMFVELVCGLDRARWDPTVVSLGSESEPLVSKLRDSGVEVRCLGVKRRWDLPGAVARLARELRSLSPDLLQTWLFHANVAGCLAAGRVGLQTVVTGVRVAERRGRWRLWLERYCTRRARRHICVSGDVAEFSRDHAGLDPSKLVVIANGVDVSGVSEADPIDLSRQRITDGVPVLAWIGRLDPQKDPLSAVEALGQLRATQPECHLVLAGEGPLRGEVESRIAELGLSQRVHLLGQISEVPSLLARCCGLVLTSHWEGMPNVVLEAMAAGRPVVSRVVEGVSDLVEDGVTGWLVADDHVSSLSAALERLLEDREFAGTMGERGQRKVTEEYSIEAMVSGYEALWERVLAEMDDGAG